MNNLSKPTPYLSPLTAGIGLGLTLLAMFVLSNHGLGGAGFFKNSAAVISNAWSEPWTMSNAYFAPLFKHGNPLSEWITWEILGLAIGAFLASFLAGRFHFQIERGAVITVARRLVLAVLGGTLTGMGAALARGCTSGLGLSGSATLTVAGFVFLIAFFVAGILVAIKTRVLWE